jgi:hypothetical protein
VDFVIKLFIQKSPLPLPAGRQALFSKEGKKG